MAFGAPMNYFLLFASIVSVAGLAVAVSGRTTTTAVIQRLRRRGPRPASPGAESGSEKQRSSQPLASSTVDLLRTFPPNAREQLELVLSALSPGRTQVAFDEALFQRANLGQDENYANSPDSKYTCTGVSVKELKALGDFPDYATLTGVPLPEPYSDFDITKAVPRPYRPFRWSYHQTMSLTKMEPDWWIELENTYKERIAERQALYEKHGKSVLDSLPGSKLACKELMEMVVQFLCARYPQYFVLSADGKWFENKILGTTTEVKTRDPLEIVFENVPEDFGIMLRNPDDGFYYLRAGLICSSLGWNLGTKMGKGLDEIHEPVPDYKEKMRFSMHRFFSKMPIDKPIQRGSWGLEVDQPLYMPPGDPHEKFRDFQAADLTRERLHLRVDWQTLRRLPLSGAIVFNFKALFTPIEEFRDEPYIPSLILKVLKEGNKGIMKYKNTWHTEHIAIPALEEYEREQKSTGVVPQHWEPETLEESPFFPGWENKWQMKQNL